MITVCASMRFQDRIDQLCDVLEEAGFTVARPVADLSDGIEVVVRDHLANIARSDLCLIANFDAYIGHNTSVELGYAAAVEALIVGLVTDPDAGRRVLYDEVLNTSEPADVAARIAALARQHEGEELAHD